MGGARWLAVALGAALLAAAPSAHAAGWLQPLPLGGSDGFGQSGFALDSDSQLTAAWLRHDGTHYRVVGARRPPGGVIELGQTVSQAGGHATGPRVAVDAAGNALLMWQRENELEYMTRAAGETAFGDPRTVPTAAGHSLMGFELAMTSAGEAILVWESADFQDMGQDDYALLASIRPVGGAFGAGQLLDSGSAGGTNSFSFESLDVAVDAGGAAYAVWSVHDADEPPGQEIVTSVEAAVRAPGAGSFALETLASGNFNPGDINPNPDVIVSSPSVAAGRAGEAAAAWTSRVAAQKDQLRLRLARIEAGAFGDSANLSLPFDTPPLVGDLAMNGSGEALAAWRQGSGADATVEACAISPTGECQSSGPLATGADFDPWAVIGAAGHRLVAWERLGLPNALLASVGSPGGSLGAPTQVASGVLTSPAPQLAVDPLGHAAIAYPRMDTATTTRAELRVHGPVAPEIRSIAGPPAGSPGASIAFSGGVFDAWGPVTSSWSFGDGTGGPGPNAAHAYSAPGSFSPALTATDAAGNSVSRALSVRIADELAPAVSSFGMSRRVFAVAAGPTPLSAQRRRRAAKGTTFRFSLSEPARVAIRIERRARGFKRGRRCVKSPPRSGPRRRCTRYVRAGTLTRDGQPGTNSVVFSGRLGRRALRAGRHRARLTATDAAGNRSRARALSFRVVRSR